MSEEPEDLGIIVGTKKQQKLEEIKEALEKTLFNAKIEEEMNLALLEKVNEMIASEKGLNTSE